MPRIFTIVLLLLLTGCVVAQPVQQSTLEAPSYSLWVHWQCPEGEVGCDRLTAELAPTGNGKTVRLKGHTQMVMCADNITPCHLGYYRFTGSGFIVLAYPDGALEITRPDGSAIDERGRWSEQ